MPRAPGNENRSFACPFALSAWIRHLTYRARCGRFGTGSGQPNAGKTLAAAATLNVQVTGVGTVPVPATASTAVLNVTVTNPTDAGFLTVFPEGETPMPTVSNLNFSSGETVANLVTVPLSATGGVTIYNSAEV